MALLNFDSASAPQRDSMDILPAGEYVAQVTESELVATKDGTGTMLKLTFTILTQGFNGRKVWARLNLQNKNPQAVSIAQQELREICEAVGLQRVGDSVELHNKPMIIKVAIDPATGQYEASNRIKRYKPASGGAQPGFQAPAFNQQQAAQQPQQQPQNSFQAPPQPAATAAAHGAAAGFKPWEKR